MKHSMQFSAIALSAGLLLGLGQAQAEEHMKKSGMESEMQQSETRKSGMQSEHQGGMMQSRQQQGQLDLSTSYRTAKLIGLKVRNKSGEELGDIDQVILNRQGQATHIVLGAGGMLGLGEQEYVVPWNRVEIDQQQGYATIDVKSDQVSSEFSVFEVQEEGGMMQ